MLTRLFAAALFFAAPAATPSAVPTQGPPPGFVPPPPPKADQIVWTGDGADVLDVTDAVKAALEAKPDYAKQKIVLRHQATDAHLAKLAAKLPWVEQLVIVGSPQITTLAPIAKLTHLRMLHVNDNAVKTLAPIAQNTALEYLTMTCSSAFTDTDLSALSALTSIGALQIRSCPTITSLHGVEKMTQLRSIGTYLVPITKLDPLAGLTQLSFLWMPGNKVADLGPLSGLTELRGLNLEGATATSFTPLVSLTKLVSVDLSKTAIADISVLAPSAGLTSITLNDATSLSLRAPLPAWPLLTSLWLNGANVTDLSPIATLGSLNYLSFDRTAVKTIKPIVRMPNLLSVTMPTAISDGEVIALQKAHPGIGIIRLGKPLPGAPPPAPIP